MVWDASSKQAKEDSCFKAIDACDKVMEQVGRPRGLIDYTTFEDEERVIWISDWGTSAWRNGFNGREIETPALEVKIQEYRRQRLDQQHHAPAEHQEE